MRVLTKTLSHAAAALIIAGASPAFAQDTPSSDTETPEANTSADKKTSDKNTLTLAPKGEWKLREYDYKCRMSRSFGSGDDLTSLWIEQGSSIPSYNITLIGRPMRNSYGSQIITQFAPEPEIARNYIRAISNKGRPVLSMFGVTLAPPRSAKPASTDLVDALADEETVDFGSDGDLSTDTAALARIDVSAITNIKLSRALIKPVSLPMDGLAAALEQLNTCSTKLEKQLHMNGFMAVQEKTPAVPSDQSRWARKIQANYPPYLLRNEVDGRVTVRVTVGTNGRAVFCQIMNATPPQAFDDTACLMMMRHARFTPATNAAGDALPMFYKTSITYRINK